MLFFTKSKIFKLVEIVEKKSFIADRAWDKIYPYEIRVTNLEAEVEANNSRYNSGGRSQRKKLRAEIKKIAQKRDIMAARFEILHRMYREALANLELYAKSLTDIPASFYHKTKVFVSAKYNYIDVHIDYRKWKNNGYYLIDIKKEKVTCLEKFIAPKEP